jgi:tRNA modification GTPase
MDLALDDTIAAIATPQGEGGLAVVRVSGPDALAIADRVFRGAPLSRAAASTLHHGWLEGGERIDEAVAAVFRSPASYTREDVVELSCHGGRLPAQRALAALLAAGARLAGPGEFTLRAFLNGRIDLVQAEAVAELIGARSEAMHRAALARLAGELSRELRAHREELLEALAEVEARVDFAEDVGGVEVPPAVRGRIDAIAAALAACLRGAAWGRALREGVQVAIAGPPNAGKSSLFNRLVGEERAIVTPIPGTTRDRVSATVELEGALFTLSDTAGLREGGDEVETIGIERAYAALAESHVVLWVVDGSQPGIGPISERPPLDAFVGKRVVLAMNKHDLGAVANGAVLAAAIGAFRCELVHVSARSGEGVEAISAALVRAAGFEPGDVLASERQALVLRRACDALARASEQGAAGAPGEIVAIELREAITALEELLGLQPSEDLLDRIFSKFCVGK